MAELGYFHRTTFHSKILKYGRGVHLVSNVAENEACEACEAYEPPTSRSQKGGTIADLNFRRKISSQLKRQDF
jgi:hypothetical protein